MEIINKTRNNYLKICQDIINKGNKQEINDLKIIEKIISKDNTSPIIVTTYLNLLNKFNKEEFCKQIE